MNGNDITSIGSLRNLEWLSCEVYVKSDAKKPAPTFEYLFSYYR